MHLGTVTCEGRERVVAAVDETQMLDLHKAAELAGMDGTPFVDMLALIHAGEAALTDARTLLATPDPQALLKLAEVRFCPPLMPVQYRDCLVFETHLFNCLKAFGQPDPQLPPVWYDQPIYYKGNRMSFIGHGQDVIWPSYAEHLDLELEMAIVVGKQGKDIPADKSADYIFGYTILNDVSARDAQMKEMPGQLGPAKGKDFDTGNILGPWILTADEVSHPVGFDMEVRVNGERWGGGNSGRMQHDFGAILAHISASETLYPGEVIGSGTVGTGCGLELGKRLAPEDVFELEIENIGILRNRIVKEG